MIVAGIDPGLSGAIALLDSNAELARLRAAGDTACADALTEALSHWLADSNA